MAFMGLDLHYNFMGLHVFLALCYVDVLCVMFMAFMFGAMGPCFVLFSLSSLVVVVVVVVVVGLLLLLVVVVVV